MLRQTMGLCASVAVLFGLIASTAVFAKDLGPSIDIPEGTNVQLLYNGNFSIRVCRQDWIITDIRVYLCGRRRRHVRGQLNHGRKRSTLRLLEGKHGYL